MAKDTYYFSHDYNCRSDVKIKKLIAKHGMLGYGIFWAIVEDLYNNANALPTDYESIAFDMRTDENLIQSIVTGFDLFVIDGELFGSSSIERRLNDRDEKSNKARESARKRWDSMRTHSERNANEMPPQSDGNAIKERKGKEKKESKESKSSSSGEPEVLTKRFVELYNEFLLQKTGVGEQVTAAGRTALKKIIQYLRLQVEGKHTGAGPEVIETETVNAWRWVLSNYDKWEAFHRGQMKLEQINSNLINIINTVKNGQQTAAKYPVRDLSKLASDAIDLSRRRHQNNPDSGTSQAG